MQTVKDILAAIDGKKTYLCAAALAVLVLLEAMGVAVPPFVYVLAGLAGVASVRHALKKVDDKLGGPADPDPDPPATPL